VHRQPDLLEVVGALHLVGRLADLLDGRQEQADQHGDDGDDDQQLDQGVGGADRLRSVQCGGVHGCLGPRTRTSWDKKGATDDDSV
jgi:hypothetical protein